MIAKGFIHTCLLFWPVLLFSFNPILRSTEKPTTTYYYYCYWIEFRGSYSQPTPSIVYFTVVKSVACEKLEHTDLAISNAFNTYIKAYFEVPIGSNWASRVYTSRKEAEEARWEHMAMYNKKNNVYKIFELYKFNFYCD